MENYRFRKIVCNAGHESRTFSENEILPRFCAVCGQPYDRRYNRPIMCKEDGSTLENESERNVEINSLVQNFSNDVPDIIDEQPRRGRGRQLDNSSIVQQTQIANRRGRSGETSRVSSITDKTIVDSTESCLNNTCNGSKIGLYNGGEYILVPETGIFLGREEYGNEILGMNECISRKHAFVQMNRLGKIILRDEGSLNGTFVDDGNGRRKLKPFETVELMEGNTIWLANQILAIEVIK